MALAIGALGIIGGLRRRRRRRTNAVVNVISATGQLCKTLTLDGDGNIDFLDFSGGFLPNFGTGRQ